MCTSERIPESGPGAFGEPEVFQHVLFVVLLTVQGFAPFVGCAGTFVRGHGHGLPDFIGRLVDVFRGHVCTLSHLIHCCQVS